jgi:hypothetical protein
MGNEVESSGWAVELKPAVITQNVFGRKRLWTGKFANDFHSCDFGAYKECFDTIGRFRFFIS